MGSSKIISLACAALAGVATVVSASPAAAAPKHTVASKKQTSKQTTKQTTSAKAPSSSRAALRPPDNTRATAELDAGWQSVLNWQADEAITHFNKAAASGQASYRLAWGYGLAYGQLAKFPESVRWFERASEQYASNGRLLSDFGFSYMSWGLYLSRTGTKPLDKADAARYFEAAESRFQDALRVAPSEGITYTRLAMLSYYRGKYDAAWKYVKQSRKLGGEELDTQFVKDLAARKPEPK